MDHTRHIGLFTIQTPVTLIGVGGIGSPTAIALAKMGVPYLTIYDPDVVDDVNIATQLYRTDDIGYHKIVAMRQMLEEFSDETKVVVHTSAIIPGANPESFRSPIIISGVDSINSRKGIWEVVRESGCRYYLDARMAAEEFHLFTVDMRDPQWYDSTLAMEDDDKVPDLPCTSKATIFTGMLAAATICNHVKKINMGQPVPRVLVHNMVTDTLVTI